MKTCVHRILGRAGLVGLGLMAVGLLSACAPTVGGPSTLRDMGRYLSFTPGQTTKVEIYAAFGQPYDVQPTTEGSSWVYYAFVQRINIWTAVPFVGLLAGGSDIDTTVTTLTFDTTDRLLRFDVQERHTYKNQWAAIAQYVAGFDHPELRVQQEMVRLQLPYDGSANTVLRGTAELTK